MSRIDQLISQYCPTGVPMVRLGEVLNYEQPGAYIVRSSEYDDSFKTPVLTAGQSFILGYTDEIDGIYEASKENPVIIFDDFTTSFHWVDFDFKVKSSAMKMLRPRCSNVLFRYVYYAMCMIGFEASEHSRYWISKYSQFEIPLPPLPVQEEIVRILDAMSDLVTNLDAEISARQKQYEHARETLLTFGEEVERKTLGEVITDLRTGLNPRVHFKLNTPNAEGYYVTVRELNGFDIEVDDKTDRVSEEAISRINVRSRLKDNDVLFSGTGTIGRTAIVKEKDFSWNIKEGVYAITPSSCILSRFLIYMLHTRAIIEQIDNMAGGSTVRSISMAGFKSISIPLPSLSVQQSIVERLDKMESLIQNLQAERTLRQKQYEYYREKLLLFAK